MDYDHFYKELFQAVEDKYGILDKETIRPIVGFSAGGSVSLSQKESIKLYLSCELSQYPEQRYSTGGYKFEFMALGHSEEWARRVFTALGNLSFNAVLGHNHTISIADVDQGEEESIETIRLRLFNKISYDTKAYGIYEIRPCKVK